MDLWENVRVWNTELENPENTKRENRDPAHEVSQRNRNSPENWARRHSSHILAKNLNVLSPGLELE